MNVDNVIVSTNDDPRYSRLWPAVAEAWERLGQRAILSMVTNRVAPKVWSAVDSIVIFDSIPGMPDANLAKVSRFMLAMREPEKTFLLSDVDMIPLSGMRVFLGMDSPCRPNEVLAYGGDAYNQDSRYPICYLVGTGAAFQSILNPGKMNERAWLESLRGHKLDEKDDPWQSPFSDESLFRWAIKMRRCEEKVRILSRGWVNGLASNRIDRAAWHIDVAKLNAGGYIDAHMVRDANPVIVADICKALVNSI
jgi:hypothetical protein